MYTINFKVPISFYVLLYGVYLKTNMSERECVGLVWTNPLDEALLVSKADYLPEKS